MPHDNASPRILVEIRDGTVERIIADTDVHVVTVDWDADGEKPAVGLVVAGADATLAKEIFDAVLSEVLAKVGRSARGG
jgi:hypothetical protein